MPVCKVLAAGLRIQLQQLSHRNVLPRAGSRCSGLQGDSVLGQVSVGIVSMNTAETWQAGTPHGGARPCTVRALLTSAPSLTRAQCAVAWAWLPTP